MGRDFTASERRCESPVADLIGTTTEITCKQLQKPTKEIVQYYYFWKNSQAHDSFLREKLRNVKEVIVR